MRKLLIYLLIVLYLPSFGQKSKEDFTYSIVFASCFQKDLVGLRVNGITLISSQIVSSDPVIGITQLGAYQDDKAVWVANKTDKKSLPLLTIKDSILVEVMLNGKWTKFSIDLKDGKIIFIDNCFVLEDGDRIQKVTLKQHKETVLLY
jgi:hypothetical protein